MKANVSFTLKLYQLCILPSGLEQATPRSTYVKPAQKNDRKRIKRGRNVTKGIFCTCSLSKKNLWINFSVLD